LSFGVKSRSEKVKNRILRSEEDFENEEEEVLF
jgi:hypothetical protein